jgi:hypothetical protein
MVARLASKHETLSSNPSTFKNKNQKRGTGRVQRWVGRGIQLCKRITRALAGGDEVRGQNGIRNNSAGRQ